MVVITDHRCTEYSKPTHPERPERISRTAEYLRSQTELPLRRNEPLPVEESQLLRAHSPELLARLKDPAGDFDGDTPAHKNIFAHACRSVGGALAALQVARQGEVAFSLLRPPGHHATRNRIMGFCYLNSIAITVLDALANGFSRVAVLDFDVHHGNGTEDILLNAPGAEFYSVHEHPAYPGTGLTSQSNCHNYLVSPGAAPQTHREVRQRIFDEIAKLKPELLAVSAGFDAFKRDPLCNQNLELDDFFSIGQNVRNLAVPTFSVLEGGYSTHLPELVLAYLKGLQGT